MPSLGCGEYVAAIADRGGAVQYADLPIADASWGRVPVDTSEAGVTLAGDAKCARALQSTEPLAAELHVYRDGERVWLGPIVTVNGPALSARDVSWWLDRRMFRRTVTYDRTNLGTILAAVVAEANRTDPTIALGVRIDSLPDVRGDRTYRAGQHMLTGDAARELGRSGANWTVLGRDVVVYRALTTDSADVPELRDDDLLGTPSVTLDGTLMGNTWGIRGHANNVGTSSDDPVYGEATDDPSAARYGAVHRVVQQDTILDDPSATFAARERLRGSATPIVSLGSLTLSDRAPVDPAQLVPGRLLRLRLSQTTVLVNQVVRVANVKMSGDGGVEKVEVAVEPLVVLE